jgi:hypothetical protein
LFPAYLAHSKNEPKPPSKGFLQRDTTTVSRLQSAKNVVLRDFAIEGTAKCSMPIRLSFCKDCLVENIHFSTGVESFAGDGEPELSLVYACGSVVKNNRVRGFHSGLAVADGYEDKNCFEEGDFLFQDNEVSHCVRGFTLYKNPHSAALGRRDLQLQILDNEFTCAPTGRAQYETASGIHLPAMSAGVTIRGNGFKQFQSGVWMAGSVDFIDIQGNRFEDCSIGVELRSINGDASANPIVRVNEGHNTFTRTDPSSKGMEQTQRKPF